MEWSMEWSMEVWSGVWKYGMEYGVEYGSMEWNMEVWNGVWKYGMEYGSMEWSMEKFSWHGVENRMQKNVGMEYEKIIFHSIPFHALDIYTNTTSICIRIVVRKSITRNIPRVFNFISLTPVMLSLT